MKKIVASLLVVCIMLALALPCLAAEGVSPRYTHLDRVNSSISISNSGIVTCSANGRTSIAGYTVRITCTYQYYNGVGWSKLATWYNTGTGTASVNQQSTVREGFSQYRIYVNYSVYDTTGTRVESVSEYKYANY